MSGRELVRRSSQLVLDLADDVSYRATPSLWRARWQPDLDRLLTGDPLTTPIGFLRKDRARGVAERFPGDVDALVARANELLEGHFRFFGYPDAVIPVAANDVDPFTGHVWSRAHAKRVRYSGAAADPKWIWELNRCQDLPLLCAAWLVSEDPRYAGRAAARLHEWIEGHPPGRGIAWSNGFEAGVRIIALAATIDALRGSELMPPELLVAGLRSLWQHGRWIESNPSVGSSANNHRIGELGGLVVAGALAPELRDARRWLADAIEELELEAQRQIRTDGTGVEQAFSYHLFVLDLLLVAVSALDVAGEPVPTGVRHAIECSGDALWAQLGEGEPAPRYGDADDGRAIVLDTRDLRNPRGVAAGITARFAHAGAARAAERLDPTACWLFGDEGAERFMRTAPAPAPGSVSLPSGGLSILRSRGRRIVVDHGPHGYLGIAAHAHADALQVDVSFGEHELICDPGVGSYFARPDVREAFRSTGFHATVVVDELSSSTAGGLFLWSRHAESRALLVDLEHGLVVAEQDGYVADLGILHRRAVAHLGDGSVVVLDRLEGQGSHRYSQRWPLHPTLELDDPCGQPIVARTGEVGVVLASTASGPHTVRAVRGLESPFVGWWSARLESAVPSYLVLVDVEAPAPVEIATLVVPFGTSEPSPSALKLESTLNGSHLHVQTGSSVETLEFDLSGSAVGIRPAVRKGSS